MAETEFALGDALAVQIWSTSLAVEADVQQYFAKFMTTGDDNVIKIKTELEKQAGEKITYALRMKMTGDGIEGDNIIEGTSAEEALVFYSDYIFIDQRRKGTKSKGQMSEQRVPYKMREEGRNALASWWAEDYDQQSFIYLSGARGVDTSFHVPTSFTGRANNTVTAPDSGHILYGGSATSKATISTSDTLKVDICERIVAMIETLSPPLMPLRINGEDKFILLMHTWQAFAMRTAISAQDWLEIQKAVSNMQDTLIYKNSLGEYAGIIMHKHRNVIRFSDYGASGTETAARALCLGAQAGVVAWGGGQRGVGRYTWNEEKDDRGNALAITSGSIFGVKKTMFNSKDFGVIAVDTYCDDPNS